MSSSPCRVRIAPSPTGDPHVGTAYVALFNRAFADANGGAMVLRIDDTDRTRHDPGAEEAILRSLSWLGLRWDEGPDRGGPYGPYRQSERTERYRSAAQRLLDRGAAYRCFCSPDRLVQLREEQRAAKTNFGYDRRCRDLSSSEVESRLEEGIAHTVRLKVPLAGSTSFRDELRGDIAIENGSIDDQILLKSDGFPTYHLSNVVDDTAMRISHVVRAEEWIISTPKHILVYEALAEPLPVFCHVPLLRNADHSKISKRKNPVSLDYYREEGYLPEALLNFLALLGWTPPQGEDVFEYEYFRDQMKLGEIHTSGPVFDLVKLQWLNGVYIRTLSSTDLARRLRENEFLPAGVRTEAVERILPLVKDRLHLLTDFTELTRFYFAGVGQLDPQQLIPKKKSAAEGIALFRSMHRAIEDVSEWDVSTLDALIEAQRTELGLSKPQIFMPLRQALTGQKNSPSIPEVMAVLGRDEVGRRVQAGCEILEELS